MKQTIVKIIIYFLIPTVLVSDTVAENLPKDIKWITNNEDPVFASPKSQKGGTYRTYMLSFPLSLRIVGPDTYAIASDNDMNLLGLQPNTGNTIPGLATHWAFGEDKKTMYFKLDKRARWSDGKPVTADDYLYALKFYRSKLIQSPWHNSLFQKNYERVVKYDDHTIAIISKDVLPDLLVRANTLSPVPKHFYGELTKDFVRKYNWKISPNTGPYQISSIKKGKSITFKRKKNWWAKDLKYYKNRYNVDKIVFSVIRDKTTTFEYFKKQKLESFVLTFPSYWHERAKNLDIYDKGYAKKIWFYTDSQEGQIGFWLNQGKPIFKDRNVRYAFAHAINMEGLLRGLLRGDYSRLHHGTIGYGKFTNQNIKARTYNIEKVQELMNASGWSRGKDGIWTKGNQRYSVKVTYTFEPHAPRLAYLKEEAKKAGIELRLQRLDAGIQWKMALDKKHEVAWTGFPATYRPQYWGIYHSDNAHKPQTANFTNTDDPELDDLIELYRTTIEDEKRYGIAKTIQAKIHEIGAFVPSYKVGYFRTVYWRWWKFPEVQSTKLSTSLFEPFSSGLFWFDKEEYEKTQKAMKSGQVFPPETIINKTFKPED
ncbi:MAG: extracellular solute-binding protein [Proteobacteria bacterium]|nr:extracellular solute-binding protein [Pseudomonadota bacterium]